MKTFVITRNEIALFLFLSLFNLHCAPKVYIIDRQTVLQEQAAGDWPDFEESLLQSLKKKNPVPLPQTSTNDFEKNQPLYKTLNSEMSVEK